MTPLEVGEAQHQGNKFHGVCGLAALGENTQRRQQRRAMVVIFLMLFLQKREQLVDAVIVDAALSQQGEKVLLLIGDMERQ